MQKYIPSVIAVLFGFPSLTLLAQDTPGTIQVITSFSYGPANETNPNGINSRGDVAGRIRNGLITEGFVRFADGSFSSPIDEPDATANFTEAKGINGHGLVCGDYVGSDSYHGFLLQRGTYTDVDLGVTTLVNGLNDAGDFVGYYYPDESSPAQGFASISGSIVNIDVPGTTSATVYGINNSGEMVGVAGDGTTSGGFFRDADGNVTYPINPPGSKLTYLFGINDQGWIVGQYESRDEVLRGFFLKLPHTFIGFDYPGAAATAFTGINRHGVICGYYDTGFGSRVGFLAQVTRNSTE